LKIPKASRTAQKALAGRAFETPDLESKQKHAFIPEWMQ